MKTIDHNGCMLYLLYTSIPLPIHDYIDSIQGGEVRRITSTNLLFTHMNFLQLKQMFMNMGKKIDDFAKGKVSFSFTLRTLEKHKLFGFPCLQNRLRVAKIKT